MKELMEDIVDGTKERTPWQCMSVREKYIGVSIVSVWLMIALAFVIWSFTPYGAGMNLLPIVYPTIALSIMMNLYTAGLRRRERERVAALQGASDIEVAPAPRGRMTSRMAYINAAIVVVTSPMTLVLPGVAVGWDMAEDLAPYVLVPALVFALGMCLYATALRRKEEAENSVQINAEQEGQIIDDR